MLQLLAEHKAPPFESKQSCHVSNAQVASFSGTMSGKKQAEHAQAKVSSQLERIAEAITRYAQQAYLYWISLWLMKNDLIVVSLYGLDIRYQSIISYRIGSLIPMDSGFER